MPMDSQAIFTQHASRQDRLTDTPKQKNKKQKTRDPYLVGHAHKILQPRPQLAVLDERAAEAQRADAAGQEQRGERYTSARRPREEGGRVGRCGEAVEHARTGEKSVVAGGRD